MLLCAACATSTPPSGTSTPPPPSASQAIVAADASSIASPEADASAAVDASAAIAVRLDGGAVDAAVAPAALFEITLERSVCYGVCPAYRVTIRADGSVTYDGDKYVKVHGTVTDRVTPAAARALASRFDAAGFDGLKVPATCPQGIATDHPTNTLTYVHDRKKHVVDHYTGNACAPQALYDLADAVDKLANTERWIRCGKGPQGYCSKP